jgi:hypothetical protein
MLLEITENSSSGYFVLGMEIASLFNFSSEYENLQAKSQSKYDSELTNRQRRDFCS